MEVRGFSVFVAEFIRENKNRHFVLSNYYRTPWIARQNVNRKVKVASAWHTQHTTLACCSVMLVHCHKAGG